MVSDSQSGQRPPEELLVAVHGASALVRVVGRGSFKSSPALKQFAVRAIVNGCSRVIVDMADCMGLDSTFMGVMAGLALRLKHVEHGTVVIMNLGPKTSSQIRGLGLGALLELHETGDLNEDLKQHLASITDVETLERSGEDKQCTLETMLEAHKHLVEADPENLPKFENVIEYLSQDLRQLGG